MSWGLSLWQTGLPDILRPGQRHTVAPEFSRGPNWRLLGSWSLAVSPPDPRLPGTRDDPGYRWLRQCDSPLPASPAGGCAQPAARMEVGVLPLPLTATLAPGHLRGPEASSSLPSRQLDSSGLPPCSRGAPVVSFLFADILGKGKVLVRGRTTS